MNLNRVIPKQRIHQYYCLSSTYRWKWNKNIDGVSLQELNLEAQVPMASLERGLERVNFIICNSFKFQEAFQYEGHIGCVKKKKEVSVVQTTHLFYN